MSQPESLRLADAWDAAISTRRHVAIGCEMAEELRRLHAENEALKLQITSLRTPLTTDQKLRIALDCNMRVRTGSGAVKYATAIEAAHGIKP
jgi:uncharacterized protein HemY